MFALVIAGLTTLLTLAGLGYSAVALMSARAYVRRRRIAAGFAPAVTLLKPLRGVDAGMAEAFASHCRQEYAGEYEILFGAASLDDPAVALVHQLEVQFPERAIRLLVCPENLGPNGKVSCLAQLLPHARYDYLIINDSDIRVGPHYLAHILAPFAPSDQQPPAGLVTALYRGQTHGLGEAPGRATLGSKLEALGISTDFAPAVLTSRWLERGLHFGLGSTLAASRAALDAIGGLAPLADYLADDYQLGARVHAAGFRVELAHEVVETSVPGWNFSGFLNHQLRWMRTMRESRRAGYAGMVFSYGLAWAFLNLIATGLSLPALALFCVALMLRVSLALGVGAGILNDGQVLRDLWLLLPRDLVALCLWAWSYASDTVEWRGERMVIKDGKIVRPEPETCSVSTAPAVEKP
jgi:ceramide glucosyltransferase